MINISNEQLQRITGATQQKCALYGLFINRYIQDFEINTAQRAAMFLANIAHETGRFERVEENLNYSVDALLRVFGKYFKTRTEAGKYSRNPQKIANRVYANRMGNGDEKSGEGWKYRGRGMIQITGKDNYRAISSKLSIDAVQTPDVLTTPSYSVKSACVWWVNNGLNELADKGDFDKVCDRINLGRLTANIGDSNGYAERVKSYNLAKKEFGI